MFSILILLIAYQLKHFLCDFPLQNSYMLGKFKATGWQLPLAAHVGVHALATFCIAAIYGATLSTTVAVSLVDFVAHFTMDRIKASPNLMGRWKALTASTYAQATSQEKLNNTYFWWALGLDQMIHHITHYAIICILVNT